jgi:hypothetical protein
MNKVRLIIFLIFFAVIGYSLSMSGLIRPTASSPECSEDVGECFETTMIRAIDGDTIISAQDEKIRFEFTSDPKLSEPGRTEVKKIIE